MSSVGSAPLVRKRPHRKVRSGCFRCKSKKVKCDERKPQCSHCERYSAECNYPVLSVAEKSVSPIPPPSDSQSLTSGTSPMTNATSPPTHGSSPQLHGAHPIANNMVSKASHDQPESLNMLDLELLHHWTLSAHAGFGDLPGDEEAWKDSIVRLAMRHTFLMHGILSVSALHLALLWPSQRDHYLRTSAHHQNLALPFYRFVMTDIVNNLNQDNCHPLFAFASITAAYSIAYPVTDDPLPPSPTPKWFYLIRGPRNIVSNSAADLWSVCAIAGPWLITGPMAFSLRQISGPIDTSCNPEDSEFAALEPLLAPRTTTSSSNNTTGPPPADLEIYRTTLHMLREAAATPFVPASQGRVGAKMAAFGFIEKAPERFIDLLSECRPEALVLMAHLCVLLKRAEAAPNPPCWFLRGAAERHLTTVFKVLDPRFRRWIQWPLRMVPIAVS